MKQIFGGSETKQGSSSQSGYGALPENLKNIFSDLGETAGSFINRSGSNFMPMGLSEQEQMVENQFSMPFTDPAGFGETIRNFLNPYRDIITQDINRQYEDQFNASNAAASQAGAFGSSRQMNALSDIDRARSDAISRAMADQYQNALGQRQNTLSSILGFGGLERGLDLQRNQAPIQQLAALSNLLSPLLGASTSTSFGSSDDYGGGIVGGLNGFLAA